MLSLSKSTVRGRSDAGRHGNGRTKMNLITSSMMETLVAAAGMTAYSDDCDRIVMAKRPPPPPIEPTFVPDAEFLPLAAGE